MRIGFLQFEPTFGEIEKNFLKIKGFIEKTHPLPEILVLPELALTGYTFKDKKEAYSLSLKKDDKIVNKIKKLCKEYNIAISIGFLEKENNKLYNSSFFITGEGIKNIYRKINLFKDEKDIFEKGNKLNVIEYNGVKLGQMICFDWFFPEISRYLSIKGAQIILHNTNLVLPYCQDAMITRAIENRVFTITANRTGIEERYGKINKFTGKSEIVSPIGEVLIKVGESVQGIFSVEIDPKEANNKNITLKNNLMEDLEYVKKNLSF